MSSRAACDDDEPSFDRFAVLREEKILYAADLVEAFSTPTRKFTIKRANAIIRKARGFQLVDRGKWMTTRSALREHMPQLFELLLEHEAGKL